MMPIMHTPLRAAAGTALAVLALAAAAGCGAAGGGGKPPPPMPFGRPASGGRTSPPPTVTSAATGARPTATTVSPSFSSEVHTCATPRAKAANLCLTGRVVYPTINPAKPCVDEDIGVRGGRTYACVMGEWVELPASVTTKP